MDPMFYQPIGESGCEKVVRIYAICVKPRHRCLLLSFSKFIFVNGCSRAAYNT